jgi:hypothetical protein
MLTAKESLLERLAVLKLVLSESALQDNGVALSDHNRKARVLRNGIAVIGFTILEDYIKERVGEVLEKLGSSNVSFNRLGDKMKEALTLRAVDSISKRAERLRKDNQNWISFLQNELKHISSTASNPFSVSKYSLGWTKSNLQKDDIADFLKLFQVEGGWQTFSSVASNANVSIVAPDQFFLNAANRRHSSAHDPNANSLFSDLVDFQKQVRSFAFTFDALLSTGFKHIVFGSRAKVNDNSIVFRYLVEVNGYWKELPSANGRPISKSMNYQAMFSVASSRARRFDRVLVVKDQFGELVDWFVL